MPNLNKELILNKIKTLKKIGKLKKKLSKFIQPIGIINQEREYRRDIDKFLKDLKQVTYEQLITHLDRIEKQAKRENPTINKDAYGDEIEASINGIRIEMGKRWSQKELKELAKRRGLSVSQVNKMNNERNWKKVVGIDIAGAEPWLAGYIEAYALNNAQLISSIQSRYLDEVSNIVYQGFQNGLRWESISDQILERYNVSESRADLIARDQVNKLNASLTETRQTELGVTRYIWRTMGDDRVRETHRENNGKIFSWDEPPADTGHPGEDINCRCYGEPVLEDLLE